MISRTILLKAVIYTFVYIAIVIELVSAKSESYLKPTFTQNNIISKLNSQNTNRISRPSPEFKSSNKFSQSQQNEEKQPLNFEKRIVSDFSHRGKLYDITLSHIYQC